MDTMSALPLFLSKLKCKETRDNTPLQRKEIKIVKSYGKHEYMIGFNINAMEAHTKFVRP